MSTTKHRNRLNAVIAALALSAASAEAQVTTLRYASASPAKTVWAMQIERWVKAVDEESNGSLKIDAFINSQLGSEHDTVQQVARGRIDIGGFSLAAAALVVPELSLLFMPLFFQSQTELECVLDTALTQPVSEMLERKGLMFGGWGDNSAIDLIGKKAYASPADVSGIKAGTYGTKVGTIFWSSLGANPVATTITEVGSSLQTGLIDVFATSTTAYVGLGLNKIAPVLTRLEMSWLPNVGLMNKASYERLSPEQREALDRAARRYQPPQLRQEVRDFETMLRGVHEKGGGQIALITHEQRAQWRAAVAPLWPQMVKESGPAAQKFYALMEAGRKACEKRG
jgi:TRAP-type C4-dicarboxylate transport system substrate-binding protein